MGLEPMSCSDEGACLSHWAIMTLHSDDDLQIVSPEGYQQYKSKDTRGQYLFEIHDTFLNWTVMII